MGSAGFSARLGVLFSPELCLFPSSGDLRSLEEVTVSPAGRMDTQTAVWSLEMRPSAHPSLTAGRSWICSQAIIALGTL